MWMMTRYGFYSIVKKGTNEWHVRAREKQDLDALKAAAHVKLPVRYSTRTDYPFRIIVGSLDLLKIFDALSRSIDYNNFKDHIEKCSSQRHKLPLYHCVWEVMAMIRENGAGRRP